MKLTLAFCLLYLVALIIVRALDPHGILFYQGVLLTAATAACQLAWALWRQQAPLETKLKDALLTLLLTYAFVFTIPTTVDRAYSVRMLEEIARQPDGQMTRADLQRWFTQDFLQHGAVEKRLDEQQATGSITLQGDKVVMTAKGNWLVKAFAFTRKLFSC